MGLSKWILRNGFGSPGHTARAICKTYSKFYQNNHDFDKEDAFSQIYFNRDLVQKKLGNNYCWLTRFYEQSEDFIFIEEDMPLFVFAILCLETNSFRKSISDGNIDDVLEVIYEEVQKTNSSLIKLDYARYKQKAITFLNVVLQSV